MQLVREGGQNIPFDRITTNRANAGSRFDINDEGDFSVEVKVPRGRGLADTTQQVQVRSAWYTGWPYFSKTSKDVIDKMIETIFLALMATTLAVPISVVLSFTSARNLMKQVGLPLGTVLIGFILMPVGAALGYVLLGPLGEWGVKLGEDVPVLGLLEIAAAITAFLLTSRRLNQIKLPHESPLIRVRAFVISILLLAVIIVVTGILGGLGLWVGKELSGDKITLGDHHFSLPTYLAEFCKTIGKLIDMTIIGIAALGGGFLVGSAAATTAAGLLRTVRGPISHVLGAVLGFLSGVILMAIVAYIGAQAVLLGLLTILILGLLGAQVMVLLFRDLVGINKPRRDETRTDQLIRSILSVAGFILTVVIAAYILDLSRIVDERKPSAAEWTILGTSVRAYIAQAALMGGILAGLAGGLSGTYITFPLGMAVYNTSRTILNALRSIEPLIMGIVFVIWVGVGPFAGVLALTLHSIASLGKLYSEQVESIDAGPIEAITATGATRLQTIIYGVVPQIVPPYISFTMYRWDINVRMSTIIGFVGGGGIGFLLQQQINLLQYKQAGVAVLAIAIVVSILDYASAAIRERVV